VRIFQNQHRHTTYSNPRVSDSVVTNEDYALRAVELGHGIISTMEHGWQGRYIEGYELAKKYNLKFVFGAEAYWVKDRFESDGKNCHICLYARNENGRQSINDILSEANITGFYKQPRIDLDLLYSLPAQDVIVVTACVAFWKYEDINEIVVGLHSYFKDNLYLECQNHNTESQKILNTNILLLSQELGIKLIMGCDSHYINDETSWERTDYLASKGIVYDDEDGWFLDYPDGDTAYQRFIDQGILNDDQINECFENTNVFLEVEEYDNPCFNYEIKMPTLYPKLTQEEKNQKYEDLIWEKWSESKYKVPIEKWDHYESEIAKEIETVKVTLHADYFLMDYEWIKLSVQKGGMVTNTGRGCFTKDSLVHTKNTLKSISDVVIGDEVIDLNGNFKKVINTMQYDIEEELIQIKHIYGTDINYPTICTTDHKILIHRNEKNDWIEASQINNTDYVCVPKPIINEITTEFIDLNNYNIFDFEFDDNYIYEYNPYKNNYYQFSPTEVAAKISIGKNVIEKLVNGTIDNFQRKPAKFQELMDYLPFATLEEYRTYIKEKRTTKISRYIKNDYIFNQFIGLLYGDGFNCENKITVGLALNTETHKDKINRDIFCTIAKRVNLEVYSNKSNTVKLEQISVNSKIFSGFIGKDLFISKKDRKKQFNSKFFNETINNQKGILSGLFLSDGSDSEKRRSFDNTSLSLINAYKILSLNTRYGINSLSTRLKHVDHNGYNNKEAYKLRHSPNMFNCQKSNERCKEDESYWYLPVKEIILLPKQKTTVYDITIEDSHSYLINNMVVHNSAVSFYTNKLLGLTKVDRIASKVHMYPERFMSATRILEAKTLADIDMNLGNPEVFARTQKELFGEECAYPMIAYGKYQVSSAFKMYAKAKDVPFETANEISKQIKQYETDLKYADDEDKDDIHLEDYIEEKYQQILEDSEKYLGIISSWSKHPCAYLIYQGNIRKEIGLVMMRANQGKKLSLCCLMDGLWAEKHKFLKNDLLKVNVVRVIKETYKDAGVPEHDTDELLEICEYNQKVNDIYKYGWTIGINQVEQKGSKAKMMKYQSKNITELTAFIAAIRPSFKSMYKTFQNREQFSYGIKAFDDIIQTKEMPSSFILYQEMIMAALNFANIPMTECYEVIKCISKKRKEQIYKYEEVFKPNFAKKIIETEGCTEDEAREASEKIWKIIYDSAAYGFNASHAYCVALDSLYGAYLKAYYPLHFYKVFMNILNEKGDKNRMVLTANEMKEAFEISLLPLRFRQDNRTYSIDKENNALTNTIKSIKGIGDGLANDLYELKDIQYSNFVSLLIDLIDKSIMCKHILELIKIGYFEEYGKNKKLISIYNEITKGKFRYDKKHTDKTKEKRIPLLIEFEKTAINESLPIFEQVIEEIDIFGEPKTTSKEFKGMVFVKELDTQYSPKLNIFAMANGKTMLVKMKKPLFNKNPFEAGIILRILQQKDKLDGKYENGKYVTIPNTKVWWIEEFSKVEVNDEKLLHG